MPRLIRILLVDILGRMAQRRVRRASLSAYIPVGRQGRRTIWTTIQRAARFYQDAKAVRTLARRKRASRRGLRKESRLRFSEYRFDMRMPINSVKDVDACIAAMRKLYAKVVSYDRWLLNQSIRAAIVSSASRYTEAGRKRRRMLKKEQQVWVSTRAFRRTSGNDDVMFAQMQEKLEFVQDEMGYQGLTVDADEDRDVVVFVVAYEEA